MNQNPYDPPTALLDKSEVPINEGPNLFLYSLTLPAVWILFGTLAAVISPGLRFGMFGLVLVLHVTVGIITWHFSKRFCRQFERTESIRLIAYSSIWAIFLETASLIYFLSSQAQLDQSHLPILLVSISIAAVLDSVFISLAVLILAKRFLSYFLNKQRTHAA